MYSTSFAYTHYDVTIFEVDRKLYNIKICITISTTEHDFFFRPKKVPIKI